MRMDGSARQRRRSSRCSNRSEGANMNIWAYLYHALSLIARDDIIDPSALRTIPVELHDSIRRQNAGHANRSPNDGRTGPVNHGTPVSATPHFGCHDLGSNDGDRWPQVCRSRRFRARNHRRTQQPKYQHGCSHRRLPSLTRQPINDWHGLGFPNDVRPSQADRRSSGRRTGDVRNLPRARRATEDGSQLHAGDPRLFAKDVMRFL
jgi:hypothetical protein